MQGTLELHRPVVMIERGSGFDACVAQGRWIWLVRL
jgi:hypothetical protein